MQTDSIIMSQQRAYSNPGLIDDNLTVVEGEGYYEELDNTYSTTNSHTGPTCEGDVTQQESIDYVNSNVHPHESLDTSNRETAMQESGRRRSYTDTPCKRLPKWLFVVITITLIILVVSLAVALGLILPKSLRSNNGTDESQSRGKSDMEGFADCQDVANQGLPSGAYIIHPSRSTDTLMIVYCDSEYNGGGWTVIQERRDATVDFNRNWIDYVIGFGTPGSNFWLGLANIHQLTGTGKSFKLTVHLTHPDTTYKPQAYAHYAMFSVGDASTKYTLTVWGFSPGRPDAGDSLTMSQNGQKFSTRDQDNDVNHGHCAAWLTGAWWYENCHDSNLNGVYGDNSYGKGINWATYSGYNLSLKACRMLIKSAA